VTHIISPNLGSRASAVWEIRGRLWGGVLAGSLFSAQFFHRPYVRAWWTVRGWRTVRDPFVDCFAYHLRRGVFFIWRRLLYCGQSMPTCPDSPPSLWRTVCGSSADSPICTQNLAKFVRFLCFFASASACALRNRS
jgi:hypothetical protein